MRGSYAGPGLNILPRHPARVPGRCDRSQTRERKVEHPTQGTARESWPLRLRRPAVFNLVTLMGSRQRRIVHLLPKSLENESAGGIDSDNARCSSPAGTLCRGWRSLQIKTTRISGRTFLKPPAAPGRPRWSRETTSATDGRVMEMLGEHQCLRWLEGYLLPGRQEANNI